MDINSQSSTQRMTIPYLFSRAGSFYMRKLSQRSVVSSYYLDFQCQVNNVLFSLHFLSHPREESFVLF